MPTKNRISDLRNHLFEAIERLQDDDMKPEQLQMEVARSRQIAELAAVLIDSAKVEVQYARAMRSDGLDPRPSLFLEPGNPD